MIEKTPSKLSIEQSQTPEGVHIFALIGEASVYDASVLEPAIARLSAAVPDPLIIDLNGLVFAGSSAVGQIMAALTAAKRAGVRAVVVCDPESVLRGVLDRVRAGHLAPFFALREDAVASLAG
jgi:anti-anti-sigma factor